MTNGLAGIAGELPRRNAFTPQTHAVAGILDAAELGFQAGRRAARSQQGVQCRTGFRVVQGRAREQLPGVVGELRLFGQAQ